MVTSRDLRISDLAGLKWNKSGSISLGGAMLRLYRDLDRLFLSWAQKWSADERIVPPCVSAHDLAKTDYLKSFPHYLTVPVSMTQKNDNLKSFVNEPLDENCTVKLAELAPATQVLTPAACFHFFAEFENLNISTPVYLTTLSNCFRNSSNYSPLNNQWIFSMREIVCMGSYDEVQAFLADFEESILLYIEKKSFPVSLDFATDDFFNASANPKYLLQRLEPSKKQLTYQGRQGERVAIGSMNFHRNFFGEAFQITRHELPVYSACVSFGLERWMYMILHEQGIEEDSWRL